MEIQEFSWGIHRCFMVSSVGFTGIKKKNKGNFGNDLECFLRWSFRRLQRSFREFQKSFKVNSDGLLGVSGFFMGIPRMFLRRGEVPSIEI